MHGDYGEHMHGKDEHGGRTCMGRMGLDHRAGVWLSAVERIMEREHAWGGRFKSTSTEQGTLRRGEQLSYSSPKQSSSS
eukprot:1159776-Pelagomonas_calceolata.AAC.4